MLTLPEIIIRPPQSYAYRSFRVRMNEMQKPASEGFPAIFALLAEQGIAPIGAPFYNYRRIDMADTLDVEAGVPVARNGNERGDIRFGSLPGGRFVSMRWHGHPDRLEAATAMLIGWLRLTRQPLDMEERADGDHFACRLEIYEANPEDEPNMDKWVTELAFKLRD